MTRIKICGLMDVETAVAAVEAGADYIGLVFAESKRQIDRKKALQIVREVKEQKEGTALVGVFVNLPAAEVNSIADYCRLDYLQISGDESWQYCRDIEYPIIKVVHITPETTAEQVTAEIEAGYNAGLRHKPLCLLDTKIEGAYGGTGRFFDWRLAEEVAQRCPVVIAGGLDADNVGELIKQVRPWGVDISGGVESDGRKDISKIKAFIQAVRQAEKEV